MSDNITNPNDYSLSASINLDFTKAAESAAAFQEKIGKISQAFTSISSNAKQINGGLGNRLKQLIDAVETAQTIEITDVEKIREKIEAAVIQSIIKSEITIKKMEPLNIVLEKDDWTHIEQQVTAATKLAFSKTTITPFKFDPITIKKTELTYIKGVFEAELRKALSDKMEFKFEDVDKDGKQYDLGIQINTKHMQNLMNAVRDKLVTHLGQPDSIEIAGGWDKPIKINNKQLQQVYDSLSERVSDIAASITIDTAIFERIDKMKFNPVELKEKIESFVRHMEVVSASLNSLKLTADEDDLKQLLGGLKNLKTGLIGSVQKFLTSINKQMENVKHPSIPDLATSLNNLSAVIDTAISAKFDGAMESVIRQMGLMRMDIDGREVLVPVIKRLEQVLLQAAQNVIPDAADPAFAVDLKKAQEEINKWAASLAKSLSAQVNATLKDLTATWTGKNKDLLDKYANSIAKLVNFQPPEEAKGEILLDLPVEQLRAQLAPELQRVANMLASGIQFKRDDNQIVGFELPQNALDEALKDIRETFLRQAVQMAAALKERGIQAPAEADQAYLERALYQESKVMLDAIVDNTKRMVTAFTEGVKNDLVSGNGEEVAQIHSHMQTAMTEIVAQFTGVMKDIIKAFTISSAAFKSMQESAAAALSQMETGDVKLEDGQFLMDRVANRMFSTVAFKVMDYMVDWVPNIKPIDFQIGQEELSPIIKAISEAIREGLQKSAVGITAYIEHAMSSLSTGDRSIKDLTKLKTAIAKPQGFDDIDIERYFGFDKLDKEMKSILGPGLREDPDGNGIGRGSYGFVLQRGMKNLVRKVFMMQSQFEPNKVTGNTKTHQEIMDTVMHEIGHLMQPDFMEKHAAKAEPGQENWFGYRPPNEWLEEWEQASRVMRPYPWKRLDNPDHPRYGFDDEFEHDKAKSYYYDPTELFADAFSLVQKDFDKAKKLMPETAQKMKDLAPKIDLIDPELPDSTLDMKALDAIPDALNRYVRRAAEVIANYIDGKTTDPDGFKQAIDMMDNLMSKRIKQIVEALNTVPDDNGMDYGALLRNLNDAIQTKIIRAIAGLSSLDEVNFDFDALFKELNAAIGARLKNMVAAIKGKEAGPELNADKLVSQIDKSISTIVSGRFKAMSEALKATPTEGMEGFRFALKDLDPEVRKIIAEKMQMTLAELKKNTGGYLTGQAGMDNVAQANMEAIFRKFHAVIGEQATQVVGQYKTALDGLVIEADLSPVSYLLRKFEEIQGDIVVKVREMLDMQFTAMAAAIRDLTANPLSLGYTPPAAIGSAMRAAAKVTGAAAPRSIGRAAPRSIDQAAPSAPSPRYNYTGTSGGGRMYYPINDIGQPYAEQKFNNPGGDTRSWMGSVRNTLRYMTAGMVMGAPMMLAYNAWDAAKETDYQFAKSQVNLTARGLDDAARQKLGPNATAAQVKDESFKMGAYVNQGPLKRDIQNIGIAYGLDQKDAFMAYQEATRKYNDPKEALALTRGLARMKSIEGTIDVPNAASGLASMGAQWGLSGYELEKASDMVIAAANTKFTSANDILETQKRSGNLFAQNLIGTKGADGKEMDKMGALATSIGLSAMFTEATGRAGAQGGTFWKNIVTSPFTKQVSQQLVDMSKSGDPRLQALNPYVEHTNAKGQKVYDTKGGLEMLLNITDAMSISDPKTKSYLQEIVAKQWHKGDLASVQAMMTDMDKLSKDKNIQAHGGVAAYFNQLKDSPTEMTDQMSAQMSNTWNFQTMRLRSTFQAASSDVLDKLKPEFGTTADYISGLLMAIREYSGAVANVVSLLTKALVVGGGYLAFNKIRDTARNSKENRRQEGLSKDINRQRYYLNEEGRASNLKRMIVADHRADLTDKLDRVNAIRGVIDLGGKDSELSQVNAQINTLDTLKADLEKKDLHGTATHTKVNDTLTDLDLRKTELERKLTTAAGVRFDPQLEAEAKKLEQELREVDRMFKQVDKSATSVNNRMDFLDMYTKDVNLETKRLTTEMIRVDQSMQGTSKAALGLRERYSMMGREAGLSDGKIGKLITDVDKLEKEFAQTRNLDEFTRKLRELERLNRLVNMGIMTTIGPDGKPQVAGVHDTPGKYTSAADITNNKGVYGAELAAGLLAGTAISKIGKNTEPGKKAGLLKRVWNGAKGLLGFGTATEAAATEAAATEAAAAAGGTTAAEGTAAATEAAGAAKAAGKLSKTRSIAGKLTGWTKKPFEMMGENPWLAAFALGTKLVTDVGLPSLMPETDQEKMKSKKLDELANNAAWGTQQNFLVKYGNMGLHAFNSAFDNLTHLMGGVGPGYEKTSAIYELADKYKSQGLSQSEIAQKINDDMGIKKQYDTAEAKQKKTMLADQLKEAEQYLKITGDPATDIALGKKSYDQLTTYDDGNLLTQQIQKDLQIALARNTAQNELGRANAIIRGTPQDDPQMRTLMKDFFKKNIKALDATLNGVKDENGNVITDGIAQQLKQPIGPGARQNLELQAAQIQAQMAQMQQNIYETDTSAVDSGLARMSDDLGRIRTKGDIGKANLILGGASDNSATVQALDANTARSMNARIEQEKGVLQQELAKWKDNDDMRLRIETQMLNLTLEQKNNLVAIKKAVATDKSTFNLPAGVTAMTYWESKVKDGTHKSVSIGNGDTNIQITIDKMTGNASDLDKLGKTVADAIKKNGGPTVSTQLSSQVNSGIQNNVK